MRSPLNDEIFLQKKKKNLMRKYINFSKILISLILYVPPSSYYFLQFLVHQPKTDLQTLNRIVSNEIQGCLMFVSK